MGHDWAEEVARLMATVSFIVQERARAGLLVSEIIKSQKLSSSNAAKELLEIKPPTRRPVVTDDLYWYLSIFGWLFLTGIGLPPVPEEAGILYAAGITALHPEIHWSFAWLATGLGIIAADAVLYGIGRQWGARLFEFKWVQRMLSRERRVRLEGRFHQHGMKLLIMARFLPPVRTGIFLIAGASKYSIVKFFIADGIYAVVGVGLLFFGGGWLLGLFDQLRHWAGHRAVSLLAAAVLGYALYRYFAYLKRREGRMAPQPPISVVENAAGVAGAGAGETLTNPKAALQAQAEANKIMQD